MLLRIKYSKTPDGRFLSHLDLLRAMERAFRRADLPLLFSEGFNPHPRISYGSALAVGVTSDGEYLDVMLREKIPAGEIRSRLEQAMPPAIKILELQEIEAGTDSLTATINLARYTVRVRLLKPLNRQELDAVLSRVRAEPVFEVIRQGKKGAKKVDVRAGVFDLRGSVDDGVMTLKMDVKTGGEGSVRPEEVVEMVGRLGPVGLAQVVSIHREGLFIREEGRIKSPLEIETLSTQRRNV